MATTTLDICNMALSALGHEHPIRSLDEEDKPARLCAMWAGLARRRVLGAAEWAGLLRTPRMQGAPAPGGRFRYTLPCDHLRLSARRPDGRPADIETDGGRAFTSREPTLDLRFVPDAEDPAAWPPGVADAVTAELAARIAQSLTGQRAKTDAARQQARDALSDAKAQNANLTRRHGDENRYAAARSGEGWS